MIAERITREPAIVERARERVRVWIEDGTVAPEYALAWRQILAAPVQELAAFVVDQGERATAMRQVTPFAGTLDPRERWRLWAAERP